MIITIKDVLEIIYYISFVVLTVIIAKTGILNYREQRKQKARIIPRINYNLDMVDITQNGRSPVSIDLYNAGDEPMEDFTICFVLQGQYSLETRDRIAYIAPRELYKHVIGWFNGKEFIWIRDNGAVKQSVMRTLVDPERFVYEPLVGENGLKVTCKESIEDE